MWLLLVPFSLMPSKGSTGARRVTDPVERGTDRVTQAAWGLVLFLLNGSANRDPRVLDLPPGEDHPRAGGADLLRQPPRPGVAPRGGRRLGGRQRPLLHPDRARRDERRLRQRPRGAHPRLAPRRGGARTPLRSRPCPPADERAAASTSAQAARAAKHPARPRRPHRRRG